MKNDRRRTMAQVLSLFSTAAMTLAAATSGAADRAATIGAARINATRLPAPIEADGSALLATAQSNGRVEVAVTLTTPAVGEGKGSSKAAIIGEQSAFLSRVSSIAPSAQAIGSVQLVANAVFLNVERAELNALWSDGAVVRVALSGIYRHELNETVPYIGAETLQGLGVTGKGVQVAVLDSGIDYTHAAFGGAGTLDAYTAAWGTSLTDPRNTTTDNLFPTAKVIGGFDFVGEQWPNAMRTEDPDPIAAPDASTFGGHGTHVADIIGGKKGVAPDVKLYAVKVCSAPTPSCNGIALLKGMEFAADPNGDGNTDDRVDIINMSLGSDYGQPFDDDLSAAVDRATKLGILTVASAGNGADKPYIIGSPAAAVTALAVAQTAVPSATVDLMTIVSPAVTPANRGAIFQTWSVKPTAPITAPVVFTPSNALGCTPFPAGSLTGRIGLVNRGTCAFADKIRNVQAGGALAGVIGLVDGTAPFTGAFSPGGPITIPGYMISLADANAIRTAATVTFDPKNFFALVGSVTSTSSRGPMFDDNRIKPEIGAPGASVSAMSGSGTGTGAFGGTSGAAPMVAGSAALIKQLSPSIAPQRLKQLLINNADNAIDAPDSPDKVIPNALAPITRIGGGEVRVDKAALASAGAYGFDLKKTGTRSGGVSFGFVDVSDNNVLIQRRIRVFNRSPLPALFTVKSVSRFADDAANDAVDIHALPVIALGGNSWQNVDVWMTIDGRKLRNNLMNSGADGNNPIPLTIHEYDGYLEFSRLSLFGKKGERFTLPWHVLPRKSANTKVLSGPNWTVGSSGNGEIQLRNDGVGVAQLNGYTLLGVSPNKPRGGRGENSPMPDLRAVGVTTFPVPTGLCPSGYLWSFVVNTWERQSLPMAVSHRIMLDVNNDGTDDYAVLNRDLSFNNITDGRQLAWALNLRTGTANANFFVEHPTNSATLVLNLCIDQVGLNATSVANRQLVRASVFTDDFYFGGAGDSIPPVVIVPFGERYFAAPAADIAARGTGSVTVLDFGAIPGATPELGVVIQTDGDRCLATTAPSCGGATQGTEVLLVAPPGGQIDL